MKQDKQNCDGSCKIMKPFIYGLFMIIFTLVFPKIVFATSQYNDLEFSYLGQEDGLNNLRITSIVQDHQSYIWIGTIRGLYRYNSYDIKVYKYNPKDSTSLNYHQINCMIEDMDKDLWVGSMFGGLSRYNREKDNFIKVDIPARDIHCMAQDETGFLWIGTGNGLFRYIKEEDRYETYHFRSSDGRSERLIQTIHCIDNETLVNIAELGIFKYDKKENNFSPFILIDDCKDLNIRSISEVYKYNENTLWLGTDQGLYRYEKGRGNQLEPLSDSHGAVIDSKVQFIVEESFQYIWIGADGIFRYNILENEFVKQSHQPGKSTSLASNLVSYGYKDRQDNIWIGTAGSGISIWNKTHSRFNRYPRINSTLENFSRDITTLAKDTEGNLWLGTRNQGLVIFDEDQNLLHNLYNQFPELQNLRQEFVRTIEIGPDKKVWIGSTTRKLTMIDLVNKNSYTIVIDVEKEELGEKDMVTSIAPIGDTLLWIGTGSTGMYLFDIRKREFKDFDGRNQLANFNIVDLERDSHGNVWIATHKNGVLKMDTEGKITRQEFEGIPFDILKNANFITIYEDNEENIWFGTEFLGLIRLTPGGSNTVFDISENLLTNEISTITEDSYGRLWISTTGGLAMLEKATNTVKYYSWVDGMASDEFNYNASCYCDDNTICLGSTNGLVSFIPEMIQNNDYEPTVLIESLFIGNQEVKIGGQESILQKALSLTDRITLKFSKHDIGFKIVALNYIIPAKNHYQYKLEGYGNSEWINIGTRRRFDFTNLRFGNYTLHVMGSNNDNIWNKEATKLDIRILPPLWLSWWALFGYLLLFSMTLRFIYKGVRQRVRLNNQIARQAFERQHQEELTNMKIQFFTNISHEFKIPLSLIIAPIEETLHGFKGPNELRKKLQLISTNASHLLNLVNLLIDFRKAEQDVLELKIEKTDLLALCNSTIDSFRSMVTCQNKNIAFRSDLPACIFEFDHEKMKRVLYNLIDNAISFTDAQDEIIVSIRSVEEQKSIVLEIQDTGCGIPEDEIEKVFKKFYQIEAHLEKYTKRRGSGIGLYLCHKIVELHKGSIKIESALEQGTSIIITLPAPGLITSATDAEIHKISAIIPLGLNTVEPFEEQAPANLSENAPLVLIVEDHVELGNYIQKLLWSYYRTEIAANGKEGLELALKINPDLIISDIMMPEMDGVEMCKHIRSDPKLEHIPLILLSAKSDIENKLEGFQTGADDYLEKPFLPKHLQSRVHNLIESREKLRAHFSEEVPKKPKKSGILHLDREFLEKVFYKIEQNIGDNEYNVNKLSLELGLSRVHLYRKFKELTGMTPKDYMKETRLKFAAKLLEEDRYTISEIAYQVGFNTHSSFTVSFKAFYGVSPKEYKAK
jgi:signal transduction histidine kinase/ligand-binding sensor domain-containing protein/DNA-binding response OmpR family regulator